MNFHPLFIKSYVNGETLTPDEVATYESYKNAALVTAANKNHSWRGDIGMQNGELHRRQDAFYEKALREGLPAPMRVLTGASVSECYDGCERVQPLSECVVCGAPSDQLCSVHLYPEISGRVHIWTYTVHNKTCERKLDSIATLLNEEYRKAQSAILSTLVQFDKMRKELHRGKTNRK